MPAIKQAYHRMVRLGERYTNLLREKYGSDNIILKFKKVYGVVPTNLSGSQTGLNSNKMVHLMVRSH